MEVELYISNFLIFHGGK